MRAIHKTNIYFGNMSIPVKVSSVVREAGTGLSNACPHCNGDVGHVNRCKSCEKEVAFADIRKAYKVGDEKTVLAKEQIDTLKTKENVIEVLGTIEGTIDPRYITGSYYLLPEKKVKSWAMLQAGLADTDKSVIVRFAMRGKQRLGALVASNNVVLMQTLCYAESIVKMDEDINANLSDKERDQAKTWVEKTLPACEISEHKDTYAEQLQALLDGDLESVEAPKPIEDETAFFTQ